MELTPIQYNIMVLLGKNGALTRRDLVNKLNTARTTIYDNLLKLQQQDLITKFSRNDGKRGRPNVYWKIEKEDEK